MHRCESWTKNEKETQCALFQRRRKVPNFLLIGKGPGKGKRALLGTGGSKSPWHSKLVGTLVQVKDTWPPIRVKIVEINFGRKNANWKLTCKLNIVLPQLVLERSQKDGGLLGLENWERHFKWAKCLSLIKNIPIPQRILWYLLCFCPLPILGDRGTFFHTIQTNTPVRCLVFVVDGKILSLEPQHKLKEFKMVRNKHQEDLTDVCSWFHVTFLHHVAKLFVKLGTTM